MSTIDVANLTDAESTTTNSANSSDVLNNTTTVDTKYITNGSAKAWVCSSTTATILKSLNVSSGTDNGTGDYSYALMAAMDSANYSQPSIVIGGTPNRIARMNSLRSTASVMAIATSNAETNTQTDQQHAATLHGDLA